MNRFSLFIRQNFQYNVLACTSKPNFENINPDEQRLMANTGVDFLIFQNKTFLHLFLPKNHVCENVNNTGLVSFSPSSLTQRQRRQWRHHIIRSSYKNSYYITINILNNIFETSKRIFSLKKSTCFLLHLYTKLNYLQII